MAQMLGLLDLRPLRRRIEVEGGEIELRALSAENITELLERFPDILKMFSTGGNVEAAVKSSPAMMSAIVAASFGKLGDVQHEKAAADLSLKTQLDIIQAVNEISFPGGGLGPF